MKFFFAILLLGTSIPTVFSQPKYMSTSGTVFLYPQTIQSSDPSTFLNISNTPKSEANVQMFDREANNGGGGWINIEAWVFDVNYNDNITCQIRVRKADYIQKDAITLARQYAIMMGQLPAFLRKGVNFVNLMKGNREWGGNPATKALDIQIGKFSDDYNNSNIMEETLVHESCHAALDPLFYGNEDWNKSVKKDNMYISEYAASNPGREDVAESFVPYLAVAFRPSRISDEDFKKIKQSIRNRMNLFRDRNLEMSPFISLECKGSQNGARVTFTSKQGQTINLRVDWDEGATFVGKTNLKITNGVCETCPTLGGIDTKKNPRSATYIVKQTNPNQPVTIMWGGNEGNIKFCGSDRSLVIPN